MGISSRRASKLPEDFISEHDGSPDSPTIGEAVTAVPDSRGKGKSTSLELPHADAVIRTSLQYVRTHQLDPNLPIEELDEGDEVVDEKGAQVGEGLVGEGEDSPYPEVRAAVRNYDVEDMPANTVRAWVIGMVLTTVGSGINCLFSLRNPSIALTTYGTPPLPPSPYLFHVERVTNRLTNTTQQSN